MSDFLHNELTNHLNAYKRLREQQPDLSPNDPVFRDTLEGESKLVEALDWAVRHYREDLALAAGAEQAVHEDQERQRSFEKRAADFFLRIENALKQVQRETGDTPTFTHPGYSLTLDDLGFASIRVHPDAKPVDISALPAAEKMEALHRQYKDNIAVIDQIKAEERALRERKERLSLLNAKIKQDVADIAPSLIKSGKKSVPLPSVTVVMSDLEPNVIITDYDVLDDEFLLPEEPPPPRKPNLPKLFQALKDNGKTVLGARLDNGGTAISFRTK